MRNDSRRRDENERSALFLVYRLELYSLVRVLPPACGALLVQILFDMVPAEATDLQDVKSDLRVKSPDENNVLGTRRGMA